MNIGAYITYNITAGGGYNQAINALYQIKKICIESNYSLKVFTNSINNFKFLENDFELIEIKTKISDKWIAISNYSKLIQHIQKIIKIKSNFESSLEKSKIDLVYFLEPGSRCLYLQKINFILTVWDNAHRDFPEFPEVRLNSAFIERENELRLSLPRAVLTICDSEDLAEKLNLRYGVDRERLLSMPFTPFSKRFNLKNFDLDKIKKKYDLKDNYFFYPAQFWAHKNHIRIIEAFKLMQKSLKSMQVVFCGIEKNNFSHIKNMITNYGLEEYFRNIGFVEESDLVGLYSGAKAIIMPTYFGPTNLPPFEAWECGKPIIYSKLFEKQVGDAALLINPDSVESLGMAMVHVLDEGLADSLVRKGYEKRDEYKTLRNSAELELRKKIDTFSKRRRCWN